MIHLFINAIGASAGGGLTYVRNVLPRLAVREDVRTTILLGSMLCDEIKDSIRLTVIRSDCPSSPARRFWCEQQTLPALLRRSQANVLLSAGNFALFRSPVPQILLSGNSLYTSADFLSDLRDRGDYRMWLETAVRGEFARWSVRAADCTVAPSATFAAELRQWTGKDVISIHHGFDPDVFFRDESPLPPELEGLLTRAEGSLRLLFVSHFNYYRNFETIIRATQLLKKKRHPLSVQLMLTCKFNSKENPGNYNPNTAADLVQHLQLGGEVVQLGAVPYGLLHRLYRACDLYVSPAYAETFAHPLVEAMASGLPVIASDLAVHREICGEAARYFSRFSAEDLAETVTRVTQSKEQSAVMRKMGLLRSQDFSWEKHVEQVLQLARQLAGT